LTGPLVSVFTPSFNKGEYAAEAISCVLAQTFGDFEYWILENSTDHGHTRQAIAPLLGDPRIVYEEISLTAEERERAYPTAVLLNRYYAKAAGRYIFYLSDDDLVIPQTLQRCVEHLEDDPARWVCWFSMWISERTPAGGFHRVGGIAASQLAGRDTLMPSVDCRIDGGQVMHRTACLDEIPHPWFPETPAPDDARHADGVFLEKLAARWQLWPLPDFMLTHRRTPLSTWDRR